jgi:hypothetical protein
VDALDFREKSQPTPPAHKQSFEKKFYDFFTRTIHGVGHASVEKNEKGMYGREDQTSICLLAAICPSLKVCSASGIGNFLHRSL